MMASSSAQYSQKRKPLASPGHSRSLSRNPSGAETVIDKKLRRRTPRGREANVYDAVAGRVTSTQPLDDNDDYFSDSETTRPVHHRQRQRLRAARRDQHRDAVLTPEEVLFRRVGAPVRFAEKDIYHAHEALPDGGRDVLPDSDLLKAMHSYASHFFDALAGFGGPFTSPAAAPFLPASRRDEGGRGDGKEPGQRVERGNIDEKSMDETALLAFGILLEEAAREGLGKRGDLVFTEGVEAEVKAEADGGRREPREDGAVFGPLDRRRWDIWRERRSKPRRARRGRTDVKDKGKGKDKEG